MADNLLDNKPWLWRPPEGGYIGRRGLRPKEAAEKVTGQAIFTNDIYLPGMLYLKAFHSPYAHARIKSMDSSKAAALPGVWKIIRYDDPEIDFSDPFKAAHAQIWFWWRDSILPDTADFQGVRMGALVVAENEEVCDQALKLIGEGIVWEQLPVILDPEDAARPDAPLMHPEINAKNNVWKDIVICNQGDVEKGFAASDNVIKFDEYKKDDDVWGGVEPGCMVVHWKGDEIEIWYHGQYPGMEVLQLLPVLKSEANRVVKIKLHTPYNGGSFGGNSLMFPAQLAKYATIAARLTGRPVKLIDDCSHSWEGVSFETGVAHYKVGFNNDGTIVAISIDTYQKTGLPVTVKFLDSLKTPNVFVHEIHSFWSKAHESCWKDGAVNVTLVNLIINKVAAHLGMDPIKVQLLNDGMRGHGMDWVNEHIKKEYGLPIIDSLKVVVEAGKAAIGWDDKWHAPGTRKLPNGKMHGMGFFAAASWSTGVYAGHTAAISVFKNGTATIYTRRCDTGQGAPTTYCQIVADEIGLRYKDVKIEFQECSTFEAYPPANSGGACVNSYGLILNARKMKKLILEYALKPIPGQLAESPEEFSFLSGPTPSPFQGKSIDDLDIRESIIFEKANPENKLPVLKVVSSHVGNQVGAEHGTFFVTAMPFQLPKVDEFSRLARQCCFVEVEVDTETGQVDVIKLVHPYDLGQSINPDVNDQQLFGGAYQGLGVSGTEAIYYDPRTGVKLNDNLIGYPILTMLDVGSVEAPIIESQMGFSPYGIIGCSEAGKAMPAAALLVPAVYNAIGKWIEDTPVTPDKVLKALGKA
jgi:CO/xanthine dehydrogenase Mo-binding subunit